MKNHKLFILPLVALSVLFCGTHQGDTGADRTVEHILSDMRSDRALAATLDSLAQLSIGPGARWLDAVKHTFYGTEGSGSSTTTGAGFSRFREGTFRRMTVYRRS